MEPKTTNYRLTAILISVICALLVALVSVSIAYTQLAASTGTIDALDKRLSERVVRIERQLEITSVQLQQLTANINRLTGYVEARQEKKP